jgi:hypothetical protein
MVGGDRWRGLIIDRLRMYYLLDHYDGPVTFKHLQKFSILKSSNSFASLIGHLINDDLINKVEKAYSITDEGRKDYTALIESLNSYVKLIIKDFLAAFPDSSELQKLYQEYETLNVKAYEVAIRKIDDVDSYLLSRARTLSQKKGWTLERALRHTYYSISETLEDFMKELCGR